MALIEIVIRNTPNDYSFKNQCLNNNASNIQTLILGSSHSFYGLNPAYFDKNTFNASHHSQTLLYDFEIIKKYENKLSKLENIIIPISYFTYFVKLEDGPEYWRVKNYSIYYGIETSKPKLINLEILSNKIYIKIWKIALYYLFDYSTITCSKLGWGTNFNSKNAKNLLASGKLAAKRHTRNENSLIKYNIIFKENSQILDSINQWANKRNVNVLLLFLPAFKSYRQNLNLEQLKITIQETKNICSKYKNCTFDNMLNDTNFVEKDYYDADHLSEIGAERLSILVNKKLKIPRSK